MNQFDYDRSTKGANDFLNWQDQLTKAMDDDWTTVEKTLTSQGAKNQLHDWWQGQKIGRSKKIEEETIRARINVLGGQYDDLRKKTIVDSSMDVDSKVSKLTTLAQQYADMGAVGAKEAQDQLWVDAHGLYKNANLSAIMKQMEARGPGPALIGGTVPTRTTVKCSHPKIGMPTQRRQSSLGKPASLCKSKMLLLRTKRLLPK